MHPTCRCNGAGWVWRDELPDPGWDVHDCYIDDTKYDCPYNVWCNSCRKWVPNDNSCGDLCLVCHCFLEAEPEFWDVHWICVFDD